MRKRKAASPGRTNSRSRSDLRGERPESRRRRVDIRPCEGAPQAVFGQTERHAGDNQAPATSRRTTASTDFRQSGKVKLNVRSNSLESKAE
jgi:hypothetical protein